MADKILSQEEVDALLKGVSHGEIETETERDVPAGGVANFDFAAQDRIVRGRMPTYEMINERFARLFRASLFDLLNKTVDVTFEGIKMMKYGEFLKNVPLPASFNLVHTPPLTGTSLLVLEARLVFQFIEFLFGGGKCGHARIEGREFTAIEQRIVKNVVDLFFKDMKDSWHQIHPLEFKFQRFEMSPQFVNIAVPTEVVVVTTIKIEVETLANNLFFCVPYSTIEPIKSKLTAGFQREVLDVDHRWRKFLEEELKGTYLNVVGELGKGNVMVRDLMNLKKGDVIQLDKRVTDNLDVKVEGLKKFLAKYGMFDGNYALQITEAIKNDKGGHGYGE